MIFGKIHFSLGSKVLIAVLLGMGVGIFLGSVAALLKPVANVFSMLLQMVVLPYVCFSIIQGIGSLTPAKAKRLFTSSWFYFFTVWILTFIVLILASFLIPTPNASMISIASGEQRSDFPQKLLAFLVPQNPFYDLSNNILPAVAIFGLIMGIALMTLEKKEPFLGILERMNNVIEKIFEWLVLLSPIGIFALIAGCLGSTSWEQLSGLTFYLLVSVAVALFMAFILLPFLVSSLTTLSYKETRSAFFAVCLVPFASGLVTLTIPCLVLAVRKRELPCRNHEISQTIIPMAYTGAQIGNSMIVFFVLFLSFYFSHPFLHGEGILLPLLTIPLTFGSVTNSIDAVSFLMQQLNFPVSANLLFLNVSLILNYFLALMSASAIVTISLLSMYTYEKGLHVHWIRIGKRVALPLILVFCVILAIKPLIQIDDFYPNLYKNLRLTDVIEHPVEAVVFMEQQLDPGALTQLRGQNLLSTRPNLEEPLVDILKTRVLRVGYHALEMPYCYWNKYGELVGYDVAYAHQLARDLDCTLEFIPLVFGHLKEEIDQGIYDIAMSSIIMSEHRIINMAFTSPYDEQNFVLIVPTRESKKFLHLNSVIEREGLKIGGTGVFLDAINRHFPLAEPVSASVSEQIDQLMQGKIDAIMWERASAFIWSLMNPDYIVIDYQGLIGKGYLSYAFHENSPKFGAFLNNWLLLKKVSGFQEKMHNYWFEGMK